MSRLARSAIVTTILAVAVVGYLVATREAPRESAPATTEVAERIPKIDVHVHLSADCGSVLQSLMDRYGFDHVVDLSGGTPLRGLKAHLDQAATMPGRVTVFTTLAFEQARAPDYGGRMAELLELAHRAGAKGLKISKALGLALPRPDRGGLVPVDDPELDVVFETAGRLGMPVAIHTGDPKAFWQPVTGANERYAELSVHPAWANHGKPVPSFAQLLEQLERRIARHPTTTFIGVHFGNAAEEPERVLRWMRAYPNLYVDLAARIPELGRRPPAEMRALFIEMQDRILYGTNLGVGPPGEPLMLGSSGAAPPTADERDLFFAATARYLETSDRGFAHPTPIQGSWRIDGIGLPRDVLEKVYWKNAARLLRIELAQGRLRTGAP